MPNSLRPNIKLQDMERKHMNSDMGFKDWHPLRQSVVSLTGSFYVDDARRVVLPSNKPRRSRGGRAGVLYHTK